MARYYFHICDRGVVIPDEEGMELPNIEAALLEARLSARDLALADIGGGHTASLSTIEIADADGNVLRVPSFGRLLH